MTSVGADVAQIASAISQSNTSNEVGVAVLKKALESERMLAAGLLQALPSAPSLASEGSLGTRVNTFA